MGYILPYLPIQQMQYASRMEKAERGLPVVASVPPIQNEDVRSFQQKKSLTFEEKTSFNQILSEIEGKGLMINETI
ncbi:hypothetical protein JYA63_12190 [Fictibacillus nanhaiensis]|uniref:Uncharacterized protein n=1 Tax=Fictibacillus nanhaiensis TaxID=742169 RepID=A0ABS2ZR99_9BACL|nr:hypothetical protein [Fictibacillus nanhaiensis]